MGEEEMPSFGQNELSRQTAALLIRAAITPLKCLCEGQTFETRNVYGWRENVDSGGHSSEVFMNDDTE